MKGALALILPALLSASLLAPSAHAGAIDEFLNACRSDSDQRTAAPALPPAPKPAPPGAATGSNEGAAAGGAAKPKKKARSAERTPRGGSWAYINAQKEAFAGNSEEALSWLLECPGAEASEDLLAAEADYVVDRLAAEERQAREERKASKKALPVLPENP